MRNLNDSSYPCNIQTSFNLVAGAVKTLTFLDADGDPVRAEHMYVRCELTGGAAGDKCQWKVNPVASLGADPNGDSMWIMSREAALLVPTFAEDLRFYTVSTGTFHVYVEAYAYKEMSGITIT